MKKKQKLLKRIARALEHQNTIIMATLAMMQCNHKQSYEVEQQLLALAQQQQPAPEQERVDPATVLFGKKEQA